MVTSRPRSYESTESPKRILDKLSQRIEEVAKVEPIAVSGSRSVSGSSSVRTLTDRVMLFFSDLVISTKQQSSKFSPLRV